MNKQAWIIIKSYRQSFEVGVPMSLLESNEIECQVFEHNNLTMPLNNSILNSVSLAVKQSDVEKAIKLLKENGLFVPEKTKKEPYNIIHILWIVLFVALALFFAFIYFDLEL